MTMYTRAQTHLIYVGILVLASIAMMTSCSERTAAAVPDSDSADVAPSAPYVAPYLPAGVCRTHYVIERGGELFGRCAFALPAGIDPLRVSALAAVSSGAWTVQSWLVDTYVDHGSINATFQLRNLGSKPCESTATVTIAVAQTMTPTAATVGVE
jgi:hypothetical protein